MSTEQIDQAGPTPIKWLQRLLNVFFALLYHQFAWTYDLVSWVVSWGQWQEWIHLPLPHLGNGPILELGSGPGHLLLAGIQEGRRIHGLDLSSQMLNIARKRLTKADVSPSLTRGEGRSLPFVAGKFSQVVATFPTEYIFTLETLIEIHRVLENGGEFLCIPMAWMNEDSLIYRFLGWLFRFTGQSRDLNQLHLDHLINLFTKAGFNLQWEVIPLKHSNVLMIRANKQPDIGAR